jgi:hypothetical protein
MKAGEIWCVVISEDGHDYTQPCADRDSAVTYVHENMKELIDDCGDDDVKDRFESMTEAEKLELVSEFFERRYEIELRYIYRAQTTLDLLKEGTGT